MNAKLVITVIIILAAVYAGSHFMTPASDTETTPAEATTPQANPVKSSGKALIGGHFTLTDQNGKPYSDADLKGHYSLVFFGFSHCPDMCPTGLTNLTAALDSMPAEDVAKVTPVFISVDPARDTPAVLKDYAANFHPSLVALTGSKEQTDEAADAFKIFHQVADPAAEDYVVNHTGYIYLMDTNGEYLRHFNYDTKPEDMASALELLLHPENAAAAE